MQQYFECSIQLSGTELFSKNRQQTVARKLLLYLTTATRNQQTVLHDYQCTNSCVRNFTTNHCK